MPLVRTSLTTAMGAGDLTFVPASLVGFPVAGTIIGANQQPVWIQDELMFVTQVNAAGVVFVRSRGADGTRALPHDINAPVMTSVLPSDFPSPSLGMSTILPVTTDFDVLTLGSSQTIPLPVEDGRYGLNGTAAITVTLPAPTLVPNGIRLTFTSLTAFAHVLSAAALINNGASGGPFGTLTLPAQLGASATLEAWNGTWNVIATNGAVAYA